MGIRLGALAALVLTAPLWGQQSPPTAPPERLEGGPATAAADPGVTGPLELYQVDLVPTGTGFAVTKPVLEGDVWVFQVWPDRSTVRLAQSKVRKITPRTKQINGEAVWQIDLAPTGVIFSRDNPALKGTTYTFHRWQGGDLMSLKQADVKKITRLTGIELFKTRLKYLGPKPIGNLPMEGGTAVMPAEPPAPGPGPGAGAGPPVNWIYEGTPGIDEAWAPGSAVVAYPGDVPKAPQQR